MSFLRLSFFSGLILGFLIFGIQPVHAISSDNLTVETEEALINTSPERVFFKDLRKYPMNNRPIPEEISKLNGKTVSIVGFMVPFDRIENITQFILLQAPFMGCLHVPPPQANETLMINVSSPLRTFTYDPIRITGELVIEEIFIEGYLVSVYTINNARVESSTTKDAELDDLPPSFHMYGDM
jgi:hypothetical protein